MNKRYVIERRDAAGMLILAGPQPEQFFGMAAITGITEDAIAKVIFAKDSEAILDGRSITAWPSRIHPQFVAREKTW